MSLLSTRSTRPLLVLALVAFVASPALAGPPLLCFPFNIGPATSLPWENDNNPW